MANAVFVHIHPINFVICSLNVNKLRRYVLSRIFYLRINKGVTADALMVNLITFSTMDILKSDYAGIQLSR